MIIGPGLGATGNLLPFNSQHIPTLIRTYGSSQWSTQSSRRCPRSCRSAATHPSSLPNMQ